MSYGALGLVEVVGSCNAVVVLDQMLKTSDVEFRTWHTKCGGHATIFLSGDIAAVKAAVDAVKGNPPCEIIERPLFLPQYVSAAPAIAPRPCDLPSCIRTTTVRAIQSITKRIVKIVLKICTWLHLLIN